MVTTVVVTMLQHVMGLQHVMVVATLQHAIVVGSFLCWWALHNLRGMTLSYLVLCLFSVQKGAGWALAFCQTLERSTSLVSCSLLCLRSYSMIILF
jgi:hypothetical protein